MTTVVRSHQIFVHATLQTAFDYVSDLTRHPEWSDGQLKVEEIIPGPIAVGKEYATSGKASIQKDRRNIVRVSIYDPPHVFGFTAYDPDFGNISHVFTFSEQNDRVRIIRTMTVNLHPILALGFRIVIYPLVGKPSMDRSMFLLKARLRSFG